MLSNCNIKYIYDRLRSTSGLKPASTDVIISNHGPILGYFQIDVLSKLTYLVPFTRSKFVIKNNCNDSFVLRVLFYLFLKFFFFWCVFKAFTYSLILFRVKVRFRVRFRFRLRVKVRIIIRIRVRGRVRFKARLRVRVKIRFRVKAKVRVRVKVKLGLGLWSAKVECTM